MLRQARAESNTTPPPEVQAQESKSDPDAAVQGASKRPRAIEIPQVLYEDTPQVGFAHDHDLIETLAARTGRQGYSLGRPLHPICDIKTGG